MKNLAATVLMMVLLLTAAVNAQNPASAVMKFNKAEIANLVSGINSDNEGLKKSSIFFAGKYKVYEAVDVLTELLGTEKEASTRLLIARALYEIGDEKGMKAVYDLSKSDKNVKVRNITRALYNEFETPEYENEFTILK